MTRFGSATSRHYWFQVEDEPAGRYNLWDCYWTARLLGPLLQDAKSLGQLDWFLQHGEPFQHAVLDMQRRGLLLNRAALSLYRGSVGAELALTDEKIRKAADRANFTYTDKFPNSRDQVSRFLFDCLGLKPGRITEKKSRPSVDQAALTRVLRDLRMKDEPHRWVLYHLFHRIRLSTLLSRYLDVEAEKDGRVRPVVKMNRVKTWRLAYAQPALQQWPPEARHIFVAAPGHLYLSADYAQLEARILSYYSGDEASIATLETGGDLHAANARDLFGIPLDQWNQLENPDPYRNYAKAWLYRQVYGGTALSGDKKLFCPCPQCARFMPSTVHLSPREAARNEERWHARHPAVKRWQAEVAEQVRATHRFPLLLGGYRYLSAPWSRELAREVKNVPMQGGAARLMIRAQNQLHRLGAPIILQHHDSFMLEVPDNQVVKWSVRLREVMEEPVEIGGRKVSFPVDLKLGTNWGNLAKLGG